MMQLVNGRVRIVLNDGRALLGQLLAYDKYMNLVVADCEEYRRSKPKKSKTALSASDDAGAVAEAKEMRRSLGLVVLRGETIVSCSLEQGAPPSGYENKARVPAAQKMRQSSGAGIPPPQMAPPMAGMMMRPMMPPPPMGMMPPQPPRRQ